METIEGDVYLSELISLRKQAPAVQQLLFHRLAHQNGDDFHVFYSETEVGSVTKKLYDELVGIPIW